MLMQELADKIAKTRDAEGYLDPMSSIHEYALGRFSCFNSQNLMQVFNSKIIFRYLCPFILYWWDLSDKVWEKGRILIVRFLN